MDNRAQEFYEQIREAISRDQLVLPTLPEVALRIRDSIEQDDCAVHDIAALLAQDGALSANFIRIANSPLYRGVEEIVDLQTVVGRMGLTVVRDLVISMALKQIFTATSPALDKQFRSTWSTGVGVAAISRMLAVNTKGLSPEQAMLAGLVHNIGVLPVLVMLEKQDEAIENDAELDQLLLVLQGPVGKLILDEWNFPAHLSDVVTECYNFTRQHSGPADYVDAVQVSLLQGGYASNANGNVPAFQKLNLDPEINVVELDENQAVIEETRQQLMH